MKTLTPLLQKALFLLLSNQIHEAYRRAKNDYESSVRSEQHYRHWLERTGDKQTWGADARKAKRELAVAKKEFVFWKKVAAELKPNRGVK